jgi:hypothetical protein
MSEKRHAGVRWYHERRLTQSDAAQVLGVTGGAVYHWRQDEGKAPPHTPTRAGPRFSRLELLDWVGVGGLGSVQTEGEE